MQAAGASALAAALPARAASGYDFTFTRLMYESGNWNVDERMPNNLLNSLVEYTTLNVDPNERVVALSDPAMLESQFCYMAGHKLLATMGMAPLVDGMGLLITVLSYNGVLSISPTSCPAVMPDLDDFTRYLRESANELEAAVIPDRASIAPPSPEHADAVANLTAAFVEQMRATLERAPKDRSLGDGSFQLRITGAADATWTINLSERSVTAGNGRPADATLTIRDAHLAQILEGKLDPQIAFVQGKLRVDGDVNKAIEFGALLPKVIA